jgi:hypothetical protein
MRLFFIETLNTWAGLSEAAVPLKMVRYRSKLIVGGKRRRGREVRSLGREILVTSIQ